MVNGKSESAASSGSNYNERSGKVLNHVFFNFWRGL